MTGNRGKTTLKSKRRAQNPMQEYDRLPADLRRWVADAILPWRARSVLVAYERAVARHGDPRRAIEDLDRLQQSLIAKDANRIWGAKHPDAATIDNRHGVKAVAASAWRCG